LIGVDLAIIDDDGANADDNVVIINTRKDVILIEFIVD